MSVELFFIYDTHCPWSYATTTLVNEIAQAFPTCKVNLLHSARYEGDERISPQTINLVSESSQVTFSPAYIKNIPHEKDSTIAANIMSWAQQKTPQLILPLLNAIQEKHFQQGLELTSPEDFFDIIEEFKISPPNKVLSVDKLTKDAESNIHHIFELQDIIETEAIPVLMLANNDNLILLNHHLYLQEPKSIIAAIELELKN